MPALGTRSALLLAIGLALPGCAGSPARGPSEASAAAQSCPLPIASVLAFARQRVEDTVAFVKRAHPTDYATYYPAVTRADGAGGTIGEWDLSPKKSPLLNARATDWRSGYFVGQLWLLYAMTGDRAMLGYAKEWSAGIEPLKDTPLDYDLGGRFLRSFGEALRVLGPADDPDGAYRRHARDVVVRAARTLDTRFDMGGVPVGALRSLDDWPPGPYPVYIDGMVNVPLLFQAWVLEGSPASGPARTLYDHGVRHAMTVREGNVRADGSTYHIVQYNDGTNGTPRDGKVYAKITDQGYGDETTWSRGQAWAIYGFTELARYTKADAAVSRRFLETAEKAADYFLAHLPHHDARDVKNHREGDFVPPTDFDASLGEPAGPYNDANDDHVFGDRKPALGTFTERDSSAAAVAASALLELGTLEAPPKREEYFTAAEKILLCLMTFRDEDGKLLYLAKDSPHRGILANAATSWNLPQVSLSFGDYYFLEALYRYRKLRPACARR
jgi:hypothetical protein